MSSCYQGFGLCFSSCYSLPLPVSSGFCQPDILIEHAALPCELENSQRYSPVIQANSDTVLITIPNIARYQCIDNKILIEAMSDVQADIQTFLIYCAIPYCLIVKGYLVLRGCALSLDGENSLMLLGNNAARASALAAHLIKHGAFLLSDYICVLKPNGEGKPTLQTGYNQIKLWQNELKILGVLAKASAQLRPNIKQYFVEVPALSQVLPVEKIICLQTSKEDQHQSLSLIKGKEKLLQQAKSHYYLPVTNSFLQSNHNLANWARLINEVKVIKHSFCADRHKTKDIYDHANYFTRLEEEVIGG